MFLFKHGPCFHTKTFTLSLSKAAPGNLGHSETLTKLTQHFCDLFSAKQSFFLLIPTVCCHSFSNAHVYYKSIWMTSGYIEQGIYVALIWLTKVEYSYGASPLQCDHGYLRRDIHIHKNMHLNVFFLSLCTFLHVCVCGKIKGGRGGQTLPGSRW